MRTQLSQLLRRFARDDRGVTLVEYGIALILAIAVGTTAHLILEAKSPHRWVMQKL